MRQPIARLYTLHYVILAASFMTALCGTQKSILIADKMSMSILARNPVVSLDNQWISVDWTVSNLTELDLLTKRCHQLLQVYFDDPPIMVFSYNPNEVPSDPNGGPVHIQGLSYFRTEHKLHPSASTIDSYEFNVLVFAIDPGTNTSVHITQLGVSNSLDWVTISSHGNRSTKVFNFTESTTMEVEAYALTVEVKGSRVARALYLCIWATNWILALGVAYSTWAYRDGWTTTVSLIPRVSVALAITNFRNLYVGTPPMGAFLDVAGYSLQMAIIALSSMIWLYSMFKSHPQEPTPALPEKPRLME